MLNTNIFPNLTKYIALYLHLYHVLDGGSLTQEEVWVPDLPDLSK